MFLAAHHRRAFCLVGALALLATSAASAASPDNSCKTSALAFSAPLRLGAGSEPGIELDEKGTVYVTAARGTPYVGGARKGVNGSSELWRSLAGGRSFSVRTGMSRHTAALPAFQGYMAGDGCDDP